MGIERRWYRLHPVTWLAILGAGAVLAGINMTCMCGREISGARQVDGDPTESISYLKCEYGWPLSCLRVPKLLRWSTLPGKKRQLQQVQWLTHRIAYPELLANIVVNLLLITCIAITTQCYYRRPDRWHQFTIESFIAIGVFVALMLAIARHQGITAHTNDCLYLVFLVAVSWFVYRAIWTYSRRAIAWLFRAQNDR